MLKDTRRISETVIRRMPVYHRYLKELIDTGIERVSSKELSGMTGFSASQIRQDLNNFGGFGQQGYGYNTRALKEQIDKILGIDKSYNSIVIGAGRLGQAIARYNGFRESGFNVISLFDIKDDIDDISGIKVRNMKSLEEYIKKKDVDVAIITVPKESCEDVARRAINAGVKGIWNFAPVDLVVPNDVKVENVHLSESLLTLVYLMKDE